MLDTLQPNNSVFDGHANDSSTGLYILGKEVRQAVSQAAGACVLSPRKVMQNERCAG